MRASGQSNVSIISRDFHGMLYLRMEITTARVDDVSSFDWLLYDVIDHVTYEVYIHAEFLKNCNFEIRL